MLELKSICLDSTLLYQLTDKQKSSQSQLRGLDSELKVIVELSRRGWNLIQHRLKTPFGECDLLFQKEKEILMIEVKSVSKLQKDFLLNRLSWKQRQRLRNIHFYLHEKKQTPIRAGLAFVDSLGKILWLPFDS